MERNDRTARRWQIFMCPSGSVHIHYGTGSLHIAREDFPGLAEDLHAVARSVCTGDEDPKHPPQGQRVH